jgi:hypothetical protein
MKSKTYARLILFLPYLSLVESIGYFRFHNMDWEHLTILDNINFWLNFCAIFWFIPYTILTIYLLLWSRKRTIDEIKNTYTASPLVLTFIAGGLYFALAIISFVFGLIFDKSPSYSIGTPVAMIMGFATFVSIFASLIVGYACVSVSLISYNILQKINFIRD